MFVHIPGAHEQGQICIYGLTSQIRLWQKLLRSKNSTHAAKKPENNSFHVPTHFATNRFTFEKFPPPSPLLHPIISSLPIFTIFTCQRDLAVFISPVAFECGVRQHVCGTETYLHPLIVSSLYILSLYLLFISSHVCGIETSLSFFHLWHVNAE